MQCFAKLSTGTKRLKVLLVAITLSRWMRCIELRCSMSAAQLQRPSSKACNACCLCCACSRLGATCRWQL